MRVLIRHCAGVRGTCEGRLIAFDRHMNLVLCDVRECSTPFRSVFNGGITLSKNQRRRRRKVRMSGEEEQTGTDPSVGRAEEGSDGEGEGRRRWEKCQEVKQLFVRGDNIILVSNVP